MPGAGKTEDRLDGAQGKTRSKAKAAVDFAHQAERLVLAHEHGAAGPTQTPEAKFTTALDPVIRIANGGRLSTAPVGGAIKLNKLRDIVADRNPSETRLAKPEARGSKDRMVHSARPNQNALCQEAVTGAPLQSAQPPSKTNPLFAPLPIYGPPDPLRRIQHWAFRLSSAILSLCFLLVIILGAVFTSIPLATRSVWMRVTLRNPDSRRPFHQEEERRRRARRVAERVWRKQKRGGPNGNANAEEGQNADEFILLEGGPDPLPRDVRYYARRVGLDCEIFDVQTEDGFIIELWHIYNPREYKRAGSSQRSPRTPEIFLDNSATYGSMNSTSGSQYGSGEKKYPVLMIHGLLQSAGAYCTNDDDSLAFFLAKSGYDVWLGNNRCGFKPRHSTLKYSDPRMWAWNIRQMGVMDLPALISRVLSETGFDKLGLIAHSQGTTQTLVALAKEQRPEISEKISVFCALAPAAYAGPLIEKAYFKFMRVLSPGMFRAVFGIHAFIPFMMTMHSILPPQLYGAMGYRVFSFLFNWTDDRWEKDLRDRMFQFAPVYVSAESMRWWLGRECFAKQKCILATREEKNIEDQEDEQEDKQLQRCREESSDSESEDVQPGPKVSNKQRGGLQHHHTNRARFAWYGPRTPPFALWVCGADDLVDGRRLLRRFERNREPYVDIVHSKIIEGYEHLDVIWAMDAIEKVGKEVREVVWKTAPEKARRMCRTPRGCSRVKGFYMRKDEKETAAREVDVTAGEWSEKAAKQVGGGGGEGDRCRR